MGYYDDKFLYTCITVFTVLITQPMVSSSGLVWLKKKDLPKLHWGIDISVEVRWFCFQANNNVPQFQRPIIVFMRQYRCKFYLANWFQHLPKNSNESRISISDSTQLCLIIPVYTSTS